MSRQPPSPSPSLVSWTSQEGRYPPAAGTNDEPRATSAPGPEAKQPAAQRARRLLRLRRCRPRSACRVPFERAAPSTGDAEDVRPPERTRLVKRNLQAGVRRNAGLRLDVFSGADLDDIHRATPGGAAAHRRVRGEAKRRWMCSPTAAVGVDRDTPHGPHPASPRGGRGARAHPARCALCGRVPEYDVVLEGGRVGFTNFSAGIMVIDPRTDELPPVHLAGTSPTWRA